MADAEDTGYRPQVGERTWLSYVANTVVARGVLESSSVVFNLAIRDYLSTLIPYDRIILLLHYIKP